jgi:uncharacterized repeat protein (TIGR01451 family)
MRTGKLRNAASLAIGAIAIALAGWAVSANAQYNAPISKPDDPEPLPPLITPVDASNIEPVQFARPATLPPISPSPPPSPRPPATRPVADPPPPLVRIQVRVPADSAPGDDLKYVITVQNLSQAEAHQVTVRNPIPDGVLQMARSEPPHDAKLSTDKAIFWSFGTLKPNEKKTIELWLKPKPDAKEVKNLAYVRFEHGEAVVTKINRPAVKVTKNAPKETVRGEAFTVRVLVENTGRVPAEKVRVVENADRTAEFEAVTAGAARTKQDENQWEWQIGTLLPGQRKMIEYRITPRVAADAFTTTNVSADKGVLEKADARTLVHTPGLTVKLSGPAGVVGAGEAARYELTVRNTGTIPSTNVQVAGTIPADCKPTMKTEGGQVFRDSIVWNVPKLDPGEAKSFRFGLKASTTGRRVVVASAADARKLRSSDEIATLFQGLANLSWETEPDPVALSVGSRGMFTVKVKNSGGEEARNVRVEVELPAEVVVKQSTPDIRQTGNRMVYGPASIPPYGEATYTITYEAKQSAQAWFKAKLTADSLGDRPLSTEKAVSITGSSK